MPEEDTTPKPFRHEFADMEKDVPELGATEFEKARGVNKIEIRTGYSGVIVSGLTEPLMDNRLTLLRAVRDAGLSLDFLKFASDGLSFLVSESQHETLKATIESSGVPFEILPDRSILTVHAVNMRDEEGLVARIVSEVISTHAHIDHMGDMHDRLLIVMSADDAKSAKEHLHTVFPEAVS